MKPSGAQRSLQIGGARSARAGAASTRRAVIAATSCSWLTVMASSSTSYRSVAALSSSSGHAGLCRTQRTHSAGHPSKAAHEQNRVKPDTSCDLNANVESERGLLSDIRVVPFHRSPELDHQAGHVLHRKRATDVEEIKRRICPAREFLWKILGQRRVAQDGPGAGSCHDD